MTQPVNTNYCPVQPHLGAGDQYGILKSATSGALMRHNAVVVDPNWDGVFADPSNPNPPRTHIPAAHQVNSNQSNPQITFPNLDSTITPIVAGDVWRFSYNVVIQGAVKAAGDSHFRVFVNWYRADNSFIRSDSGPWFSETSYSNDYAQPNFDVVGEFIVPADADEVRVVADFLCPSPINAWAVYNVRYEKGPFLTPVFTRPDVAGIDWAGSYVVDTDPVTGRPSNTRYEVTMGTTDVEFYDPEISGMVRLDEKPWRLNGIRVEPGGGLAPDSSAPYTWSYLEPELYTALAYFDFTFANITKTHTFTAETTEWIAAGQDAIAEWETQNPGQTWDPAWNWPNSLL